MKQYGIPTDQFAKYSTSVHHDALAVRGDLSAPTCTTCHGNHGAVPPGVDKVQNVCANCHVFQAQMYAKSTHSKVFQDKRPSRLRGLPHQSRHPSAFRCHARYRPRRRLHAVPRPRRPLRSRPRLHPRRPHAAGSAPSASRPGSPSRRVCRHGSQRGAPQPGSGARCPHQGPRHHPQLSGRPSSIRTFRSA